MKTLSLDELVTWCEELTQSFKARQLVLLSGPLGVGKTELVKQCVKALGGSPVTSPTFSLINEYPHPQKKIYHIDLYRIEDEDDLESIGFWDLFENENTLLFIEWHECINPKDWPSDWAKIKIQITANSSSDFRNYQVTQ